MWGQVPGKRFFEPRPSTVRVDTSIVTIPKPPPSGGEYFDQDSMDHRPIRGRRAPDIPDTRRPAYLQAKRMRSSRSADHFRSVTGEQQSRFKSDFTNPLSLEGSQFQDTPGSLMHCADLNAQLRMMPLALQEYVRELQMKAQKRENTSQAGTGCDMAEQ